jgi:hypothetical protein
MAIIAFALALVLPAIPAAREEARRVQCRDNLHQYVLRMQEHGTRGTPDGAALVVADCEARLADGFAALFFLAAAVAAVAILPVALGALFIKRAVHSFNRRDDQFAHWPQEQDESRSFLDRWFCPPSSAPL